MRALLLVSAVTLAGCMFQSLTPAEKLREAVLDLNDAARWGRLDVATTHVHGTYRDTFSSKHHAWGRSIQLADVEVVEVRMVDGPPADENDPSSTSVDATSTVSYNWYSLDTMTLHSSVVRQKWTKADLMSFELTGEDVIAGETRLLAPPPAPEGEAVDEETDATDRGAADARAPNREAEPEGVLDPTTSGDESPPDDW